MKKTTSYADYATIAYSAATGTTLWASRYGGSASSWDQATSLAVSPGGDTVYATGYSRDSSSGFDYATLAHNAATGAQVWASRYNGYGTLNDVAYSVAVSPGTGTVFVTGPSAGNGSGVDYATIAYSG